MDIERRISWLRRAGLSLAIVTVSISLMPLVASADVGDVVNTAADTTGNVVNTAADTTGNVVDTAADTTGNVVNTAADTTGNVVNTAADTTGNVVNTAADTTGNVVNTAADTTGNVVNTAADTTGNVVNTAADTTGNAASTVGDTVGAGSGSVNGGTPGDHSNGAPRSGPSTTAHNRSSDRIRHHTSAASGSDPRWQVRRDAYEQEHLSVVGYQVGTGSGGQEPTTDPCKLDQRLVCLGLLFGLGEFADTGAEVLGNVLANTGVGVIGLMVLTAMLLIAGSAALAASSRRMRVVTRTG